MSEMQPYDKKEYTSDMPYRGAAHGADTPASGFIAGSHARISDRARKEQFAHLGFDTREDHENVDEEVKNAVRELKLRRLKRIFGIFVAVFVLALVVGLLVSSFWGFNLWYGLLISLVIGAIMCVMPIIVHLICKRK